jgi:hypothetical protein
LLLELLEPAAPAPALDPDPGPEPAPGEPALSPLDPPLWPCVLLVAAAPVCLVFFFDLWIFDASLSALPAADASFDAVCIEDMSCDLPLMLEVLLFDDFDLLDFDFEVLDVSSLIEALPLAEPLLLSYALGLELLEVLELGLALVEPDAPMLDEPLAVLELLPLEP